MTFLFRGEENTSDKLNWLTTQANEPFDVDEIGFRILNVNAGLPGVQVFPAVDGDFEDVTVGDGHYDVGSYFAHDGTTGDGWTPEPTQELGTYQIEWRWKDTSSSAFQTAREQFTIVATTIGAGSPLIVSVADVRAEGLPDPPTDSAVQAAIMLWQAFIERACRQWFYPRALELFVDGSDSDALHFGVPIVSIEELEINRSSSGTGDLLPAADYRVYSSIALHDRQNPRIKLVDRWGGDRDIFTQDYGYLRFRKGRQNIRVKGVFGCVEEDGSAPALIKRALVKLVIEKLRAPIIPSSTSSGIIPPLVAGLITEEWTDGHRLKYAIQGEVSSRAPGLSGITNDQEILTILKLYKAPIGIATPNTASV